MKTNLIIELLCQGLTQKEVSQELKRRAIKPNSLSHIEKELKKARYAKGCKTIFEYAYKIGKYGVL